VSGLALLAGSMGLAALATPAVAQCVEGVPGEYSCSGDLQVGQVIVGDDVSASTTAGFMVDTTANGGGLALSMTGAGQITYVDLQTSALTGAGVRFHSTGGSGLDAGSIVVFSDGAIVSDGNSGLHLENEGGGDLTAVWSGSIFNSSGSGVYVATDFGSGDVSLTVGEVYGTEPGIWMDFDGNGSLALVANGDITGLTGSGIYIDGGAAGDDYDIQVGNVTGGAWGIEINNQGTDSTRLVATGTVTGLSQAGITVTGGVNTTDIEVDAADVNGETYGIEIANYGTGDTTVRSSGMVAGADRAIDIATGTSSQSVTVEAVDAIGDAGGIVIEHEGSAGVSVTATGVVGASSGTGIYIESGSTTTDISVQAASVSGGYVGIRTIHDGLGSTFVGATGPVVAGSQGILAEAGSFTTDMTIEVGDVTGGLTGIDVINFGSGFTSIRSTGAVVGGSWDGISVQTGTGSEGVVIEAVDVQADGDGIIVENLGSGGVLVQATGDISARFGSGIEVTNGFGTTEIEIEAAAVAGGDRGIWATSEGLGGVYVTATGPVSGDDFGILAELGAAGANVLVGAVDVFSDGAGIMAINDGDGFTRIISTGTVVGTNEVGISAFAGAGSFNVFIDANNVSGGVSGVSAVSFGLGPVEITARGVVQGGDQGIGAISDTNSVVIVNEGTVRNSSGLASDRAITASGAGVTVDNWNLVIGELSIDGVGSLFRNEGIWMAAGGASTFAGGDDVVFNRLNGVIHAGSASGVTETTTWTGLEAFINRGLLRMTDGGAGDVLQITGGASFEDTALLAVDIGGAGLSDVVRTAGAVDIEPGSQLTINTTQPLILGSQYVVVDATGGVTGEFDFDDELLTNFAGLRDGYTATTAFVEFVQLKALAEAALTPNQEATAEGADSLPDGNAVKDALLLLPDDASAQEAFDLLSGEIHPAARTAVVEDARLPRTTVLDRLGDDEPERSGWGRAFGSSGRNDGDSNAAELERETRGFLVGADALLGERVTVGVAGGWLESDLDVADRNSEGTVESLHALAYAGARFGAFGLRGGVGYAATSVDTRRRIAFQGFSAVTTAKYDGAVLQGFVEAGYRMPLGKGHIEPFVNLTALKVESDAFTEAGGPAALSGDAASEQTAISSLGLRFETSQLSGPLTLRGSAGWRHVSGDLDPVGVHAFEGGDSFTVLGAAQSSDAFLANVEARWQVSPGIAFGVAYDGVLGSDGQDHAITGSFRVVF